MTNIGKYEIVEQIGRGAMGVVYKARDPLIERLVAIKTISADLDAEPRLRSRFFREVRTAGRLSHKNIVTIYDLGEQEGSAYMVMEFLDGEDLNSWIKRRERAPVEQTVRVMIEILEGLAHAHQMGVVHRDIKPGNIFVTRSGEVKILDFGLARLASSDVTRTRSVMGTPHYMSPEQLRGDHTDRRSDIFSVGATCYELLTHRKPFHASSLPATLFKIMHESPEAPETIDPAIPHGLSAIVLRALEKDPANRYQSAGDMAGDLEQFRATLGERKQELRQETEKAVSLLNQLLSENLEIIQDECRTQIINADIVFGAGLAGHADSTRTDVSSEIPNGYLDMIGARDKAEREIRFISGIVEEHRKAASLLEEAAALERAGELEKALEIAGSVPPGSRVRSQAIDLMERVREKRLEQSREEKRRRVTGLLDQARLRSESGNLSEAVEYVDQALALDSENAEAAALRGNIVSRIGEEHRRLGLARKAEDLMQAAQARFFEEDLTGALRYAAQTLAIVPDHRAALELASRVEQLAAERQARQESRMRMEAALDEAREALGLGDVIEARRKAESALELDPQSAAALELLKRVIASEQERQAESEKQERITGLLQKSRSLIESGGDEAALRALEALLQLDPRNVEGLELRKTTEARRQAAARIKRERRQKVASSLRQIRSLRRSGKLVEALQRAGSLALQEPEVRGVQRLLRSLEDEKARKALKELQRKGQRLLLDAAKLADRKEYGEAAAILDGAEPGVRELQVFRLTLEQYRAAAANQLQARRRVERDRNDRVRYYIQQADRAAQSGDLEGAVRLVQSALSEDSSSIEARNLLNELQRDLDRRERVRKRLEPGEANAEGGPPGARGHPEETPAYEVRVNRLSDGAGAANIRFGSGELEERHKPVEGAVASGLLGEQVAKPNSQIEARQALVREQEQAEDRAKFLYGEAERLFSRSDFRGAARFFDLALELWPELPGAHKLKRRIENAKKAAGSNQHPRGRIAAGRRYAVAAAALAGISVGVYFFSALTHKQLPPQPATTNVAAVSLSGGQIQKRDADAQGIQHTLARYKGAFERKDLKAVREIWPAMTREQRKSMQKTMRDSESIQVTMLPAGDPEIKGDAAVVTCRYGILQKLGRPGVALSNSERLVSVRLRRKGNTWLIESIW